MIEAIFGIFVVVLIVLALLGEEKRNRAIEREVQRPEARPPTP